METSYSSTTARAIIVTNTIAFKDFLKHSFIIQFKTRIWFLLVILACMYAYVAYHVMFGNTPVNVLPTIYQVYIFYLFVLMPAVMYFQTKRYYKTNKYLKESIVYTFTKEAIDIEGETFSSKLAWRGLYKIEEISDWLLIYTDKYIAIRILKNNFKSQEDLQELKEIIKNQPVNQKLKK